MYLSANEIEQLEGVEKQHFLNPEALRINKSLGDAVGLRNLGVHQVLVPAGHYSTEYHVHYYEEECIYILSGTGVATLGDQQQRIGPGDFIGCPSMAKLTICSTMVLSRWFVWLSASVLSKM